MPMGQAVRKGCLIAFGVGMALLLVEVALPLQAGSAYRVWPPGLSFTFHPRPELLPGVSGSSRFFINSEGMRADPPRREPAYRILTVGGSATECLFLDQAETWPDLMQQRLDSATRRVVVANVGRSGQASRQHVLHVRHLLAQHPEVNAVVALVGINDLQQRLEREDPPRGPFGLADYQRAFTALPGGGAGAGELSFLERRRLVQLLRPRAAPTAITREQLTQDPEGEFLVGLRARRRQAGRAAALPDLTRALADYRSNLESIVDAAASRQVRLVLATQPALWRPDLPPQLDDLLWFGWAQQGAEYYTAAALAAGLARFNAVLLDVCRVRGVECVDLAARLPRDATVFYDDCHFNESGARQVATLLAERFALAAPASQSVESDASLMTRGLDLLYARKDYPGAATLFGQLLERNPDHFGANYQLATALERGGKPAEARARWARVLTLAERFADQKVAAEARARLSAP
jgi:lysophospholipase L1-like esterase